MYTELPLVRISAHRNNNVRYRKILRTGLTRLERAFVERRLSEERVELASLVRQARGQPRIEALPPVNRGWQGTHRDK